MSAPKPSERGHSLLASGAAVSTTRFPRSVYSHGTEPDARFSLANERTFLAWVRTALALVAGRVALEVLGLDLHTVRRRIFFRITVRSLSYVQYFSHGWR